MTKDFVLAVIEHMTDKLNYQVGHGAYPTDLHHFLCNEDYFIIGTWKAKQMLGEHAFDAIGIIKEYEEDNFGEVNTDFSSPEKVCNMLAYIVGEYVLCFSKHFQKVLLDSSNVEKLTKEDIHKIRKELKQVKACCVISLMEHGDDEHCIEEAA